MNDGWIAYRIEEDILAGSPEITEYGPPGGGSRQ